MRGLYQLRQLIDHFDVDTIKINANVHLYQGENDPVVEPSSLEALDRMIEAESKSLTWLDSDIHGVIYHDVDEVQQKICASIVESV